MRTLVGPLAILLGAAAVACGGGEGAESGRVIVDDQPGDTTTYVDSATGVRLTSPDTRPTEFTVVDLPEGFPAIPRPPGALVIAATRDPLPAGGAYSSVTFVVEGRAKDVFGWYMGELDSDGWGIVRQSQLDQVYKLHARGQVATLDLAVQVHPDYPGSGWTRVLAFVRN